MMQGRVSRACSCCSFWHAAGTYVQLKPCLASGQSGLATPLGTTMSVLHIGVLVGLVQCAVRYVWCMYVSSPVHPDALLAVPLSASISDACAVATGVRWRHLQLPLQLQGCCRCLLHSTMHTSDEAYLRYFVWARYTSQYEVWSAHMWSDGWSRQQALPVACHVLDKAICHSLPYAGVCIAVGALCATRTHVMCV